jgi:hypothetical protein
MTSRFFSPLLLLVLMLISGMARAQQELSTIPPSPVAEDRGENSFEWEPAILQSALFLGIEHGFRLTQAKTREELRGPFFSDYFKSVRNIRGWDDGDSIFTSYVAHPMQGAIAGFIQIHNDPNGRDIQVAHDSRYWRSRLKAMGWSAIYSTQFEIGPISEGTIGNVGKKDGTGGLVDFVVTPTGGFGWILAEDALDRYVIRKKEAGTSNLSWRRFYRMALNPTRTFANLLRLKKPWHRDDRLISGGLVR